MKVSKALLLGLLVASTSIAAERQDEPARGFCTVFVSSGQPRTGGRCVFRDEVMTGIRSLDPMTILCSRLSLLCRDKISGKDIPVETDLTTETQE